MLRQHSYNNIDVILELGIEAPLASTPSFFEFTAKIGLRAVPGVQEARRQRERARVVPGSNTPVLPLSVDGPTLKPVVKISNAVDNDVP